MDNSIDFDLTEEEKEHLNDSYTPTDPSDGFVMKEIELTEEEQEWLDDMIDRGVYSKDSRNLRDWYERKVKEWGIEDKMFPDPFDEAMKGV